MDLSKNLVVPATLALAILAGAVGFGRQSSRAEQMEAGLEQLRVAQQAASARDVELERGLAAAKESLGTRVTTLEVTISNMNQALGRIEGKLDRGSVVQAGGRTR